MLYFNCDYMEGAHQQILNRLIETNLDQTSGYGDDPYTKSAQAKIKDFCHCPSANVYFLIGGTQANSTVIKCVLHVTEGVIAADSGHISVHEAGAVEATGHKVLVLPGRNEKITSTAVDEYMTSFFKDPTHPHMVQPGMVYISHPTEFGTLYSKEELSSLSQVCHKYHLPLYMDGARLGYGLASPESDLTPADIASLCDIFLIGGTKVGAMFGEAVVVTNPALLRNFFTAIKQSGALLAKGRMLGIQFDTLFTGNLYLSIAKHAVDQAMRIKHALAERHYEFYIDSPTNQQFVILTPEQKERLAGHVEYDVMGADSKGRAIVRFATSWATKAEDVTALIKLL